MKYYLYNPKSQNSQNPRIAFEKAKDCKEELTMINVLEIENCEGLISILKPSDEIYLFGGDGTLNRFINNIQGYRIPCNVYFYSCGTGNDFVKDLDVKPYEDMILINDYIENLPIVTVNGKEYRFINGVGYGIDGYCCEEGDRLQAKGTKKVNYTKIAIKGLFYKFKPVKAKVTVDGVTKEYKHVWLVPTMKGRFYGGGMMIAPNQNRLNQDGKVSTVVLHCASKIKTLILFPSIFKGQLINKTKNCEVITGHNIEVEFSRPTPLQIDGETIKNVTKYTVRTNRGDIND